MSEEATKDLEKNLVEFDPEIGLLIEEEQALVKVSEITQNLGKETDAVDEILKNTHEETSEKIEAALKSDPDSMKNVEKLVQARLKEYGGIENTLDKLRDVDITKVPRFLQKLLRNHLQRIIPVLKSRNATPDFIVILEDLLKKIIDYLLKTSKKLRNRVGGKLNKTKKRIIKGGNEGMLFVIGFVAFLIACCCTGIGCIICGPILVGLFCVGIGAEFCGAIANAFSRTSVPVRTPSVSVGTPSVPVGTPSVSVGKPEEKDYNRKGGKTKRRRRHK